MQFDELCQSAILHQSFNEFHLLFGPEIVPIVTTQHLSTLAVGSEMYVCGDMGCRSAEDMPR